MSEDIIRPFEEKMVSSALLEIPRNTYQRGLNPERVKRISHSFDERIANEPNGNVSFWIQKRHISQFAEHGIPRTTDR